MLVEGLVGLVHVGFGESMVTRSLWTGWGSRRGREDPPVLLWIPRECVALDFLQKVEAHGSWLSVSGARHSARAGSSAVSKTDSSPSTSLCVGRRIELLPGLLSGTVQMESQGGHWAQ